MKSTNSARHSGLGEAIFAVYGITRGMDETGLIRMPHRWVRRVAHALRERMRRSDRSK